MPLSISHLSSQGLSEQIAKGVFCVVIPGSVLFSKYLLFASHVPGTMLDTVKYSR